MRLIISHDQRHKIAGNIAFQYHFFFNLMSRAATDIGLGCFKEFTYYSKIFVMNVNFI